MLGGMGDGTSTIIVIPSRLQVFLSRELFGWPFYSIILAIGQVCLLRSWVVGSFLTIRYFTDVERDELSNRIALWFEWAGQLPTVRDWRCILRSFRLLVSVVPVQACHLGSFPPLVLLRRRLPPDRTSLYQQELAPFTRCPFQRCDLVVRGGFCRWFRLLRS